MNSLKMCDLVSHDRPGHDAISNCCAPGVVGSLRTGDQSIGRADDEDWAADSGAPWHRRTERDPGDARDVAAAPECARRRKHVASCSMRV